MKKKLPTAIEVAARIAVGHSPLYGEEHDFVREGRALRLALAAGYIRENHGCWPDWGSYSVTDAGRAAVAAVKGETK